MIFACTEVARTPLPFWPKILVALWPARIGRWSVRIHPSLGLSKSEWCISLVGKTQTQLIHTPSAKSIFGYIPKHANWWPWSWGMCWPTDMIEPCVHLDCSVCVGRPLSSPKDFLTAFSYFIAFWTASCRRTLCVVPSRLRQIWEKDGPLGT